MSNSQIRDEYLNSVNLFNAMIAFSNHPDDIDITAMFIKIVRSLNNELVLLPSGKHGKPIALALENQLFDIASYLLVYLPCENIQDTIVSYDDENKGYTLKEVFEESTKDFNENIVLGDIKLDIIYQRKVNGNNVLKKILN